jgi:Ser/Thr protein kinase RdoA (MazF antagonist)
MKSFLKDLVGAKRSTMLAENIEYRRCLIHGDLHLANIMIGSADVLIDFARSSDGPVAVDAAKLISDFLLRMPDMRDGELPSWDSKSGLSAHILGIFRDSFQFEEGDKKLFSLFLAVNLAVALQYDDVEKETKVWIRSALSRVIITGE